MMRSQNLLYSYDAIGNVKTRTGVGTYHYAGTHSHAVSSISGAGAASYSACTY